MNQTGPLIVNREDDLLTLTLNRPDQANSLNAGLVESLIEALTNASDTRLCVIKAEGKHFCTGFDLSDLETVSDGDLLLRFVRIEQMLQLFHHAPFPIIALAQGQIIGAGADLFAACWTRVTSAQGRLKFPGWQFELALGSRRLSRLIGPDAARDLLIDSRGISADQALACGLASEVQAQSVWPELIAEKLRRCRELPQSALTQMLELTTSDSRSEDIAALVISAAKPGLKQRIIDYRSKVLAAKAYASKFTN